MIETQVLKGNDISGAPQLAAFHASRMMVYGILSRLTGSPFSRDTVGALKSEIDATPLGRSSRAQRLLADALRKFDAAQIEAEHARLFEGSGRTVDVSCPLPASETRHAGYAAALLPMTETRDGELRALSVLADRTAWAIRSGEFNQATALADLQARWLHQEGEVCLGTFAREIEQKGGAFYAFVGQALRQQIEDDATCLALPAFRSGATGSRLT